MQALPTGSASAFAAAPPCSLSVGFVLRLPLLAKPHAGRLPFHIPKPGVLTVLLVLRGSSSFKTILARAREPFLQRPSALRASPLSQPHALLPHISLSSALGVLPSPWTGLLRSKIRTRAFLALRRSQQVPAGPTFCARTPARPVNRRSLSALEPWLTGDRPPPTVASPSLRQKTAKLHCVAPASTSSALALPPLRRNASFSPQKQTRHFAQRQPAKHLQWLPEVPCPKLCQRLKDAHNHLP